MMLDTSPALGSGFGLQSALGDGRCLFDTSSGHLEWIQPSGPRRPGEGTEADQQGIVSIEMTPTGGALVRVTLLAAGFLIGPSGMSVREISKRTGADVKSWTEPAQGAIPATRVFLVQGAQDEIMKAAEIMCCAVLRHKELCEGRLRGHQVSRVQTVCGVEFSYHPPPKKRVPHAATIVGRPLRETSADAEKPFAGYGRTAVGGIGQAVTQMGISSLPTTPRSGDQLYNLTPRSAASYATSSTSSSPVATPRATPPGTPLARSPVGSFNAGWGADVLSVVNQANQISPHGTPPQGGFGYSAQVGTPPRMLDAQLSPPHSQYGAVSLSINGYPTSPSQTSWQQLNAALAGAQDYLTAAAAIGGVPPSAIYPPPPPPRSTVPGWVGGGSAEEILGMMGDQQAQRAQQPFATQSPNACNNLPFNPHMVGVQSAPTSPGYMGSSMGGSYGLPLQGAQHQAFSAGLPASNGYGTTLGNPSSSADGLAEQLRRLELQNQLTKLHHTKSASDSALFSAGQRPQSLAEASAAMAATQEILARLDGGFPTRYPGDQQESLSASFNLTASPQGSASTVSEDVLSELRGSRMPFCLPLSAPLKVMGDGGGLQTVISSGGLQPCTPDKGKDYPGEVMSDYLVRLRGGGSSSEVEPDSDEEAVLRSLTL